MGNTLKNLCICISNTLKIKQFVLFQILFTVFRIWNIKYFLFNSGGDKYLLHGTMDFGETGAVKEEQGCLDFKS